jgi:hypothetical protein
VLHNRTFALGTIFTTVIMFGLYGTYILKGAPLEQADLVRNYFLMRFPVTDQQAIYNQLWLPMQNRLGTSLTEFMRHFLGSEGEEIRRGQRLRSYQAFSS